MLKTLRGWLSGRRKQAPDLRATFFFFEQGPGCVWQPEILQERLEDGPPPDALIYEILRALQPKAWARVMARGVPPKIACQMQPNWPSGRQEMLDALITLAMLSGEDVRNASDWLTEEGTAHGRRFCAFYRIR